MGWKRDRGCTTRPRAADGSTPCEKRSWTLSTARTRQPERPQIARHAAGVPRRGSRHPLSRPDPPPRAMRQTVETIGMPGTGIWQSRAPVRALGFEEETCRGAPRACPRDRPLAEWRGPSTQPEARSCRRYMERSGRRQLTVRRPGEAHNSGTEPSMLSSKASVLLSVKRCLLCCLESRVCCGDLPPPSRLPAQGTRGQAPSAARAG